MAAACHRAVEDAGLTSMPAPDLLAVVDLLSWRSANPARRIAEALGISPRLTGLTTMGGNGPQTLVNHAAAGIQRGDFDLVLLTGGEARRTQRRARAEGLDPWPKDHDTTPPDRTVGDPFVMASPEEIRRGLTMPVQLYPMFESALRAQSGRTPAEHTRHIAQLWADFARVAADNPYAWTRTSPSADDIATAGPSNRMVGLPYTKSMNSNNDVDQSAALVMCSAQKAADLGVSRDRWIFPLSGTGCHEHPFVSHRWSYTDTPAIRHGAELALSLAGANIDDVELIDLYSCFPSAVQLGATSLKLSFDRQLTRTGGLSFAGGPWNNYSMHAIATMMNDLRDRPQAKGLVWANGGFVTKHAFGVYATEPGVDSFRYGSPQKLIDALPSRVLATPLQAAESTAPMHVEAYTVMHDRDGQPERVICTCLLADGRRAWGTSSSPDVALAFADGEWVGRAVSLRDNGDVVA